MRFFSHHDSRFPKIKNSKEKSIKKYGFIIELKIGHFRIKMGYCTKLHFPYLFHGKGGFPPEELRTTCTDDDDVIPILPMVQITGCNLDTCWILRKWVDNYLCTGDFFNFCTFLSQNFIIHNLWITIQIMRSES